MKELIQKKIFAKRKYIIKDDAIYFQIKNFLRTTEGTISYEHLYREIYNHQEHGYDKLLGGIIFLVLGGWAVFYLTNVDDLSLWLFIPILLGLALLGNWVEQSEKYWKIKIIDNRYLVICEERPNAEEVNAFLENLFATRDAYLINEYGIINTNLNYAYQLEQFKKLRRLKVWTDKEFKQQCEKLKLMHESNNWGFNFREFCEN